MRDQTIFKLKSHVTNEDLVNVGFVVAGIGALRETDCGDLIYIPLRETSKHGYRVIQYDNINTVPEDMNPKDIEDLIAQDWVEKIKYE